MSARPRAGRWGVFPALVALALPSGRAWGAREATVPAAPGLKALSVKVDPERRVLHLTVGDVASEVAIGLPAEELGPAPDVTVESIAVAEDEHVVHVRLPSRTRADVAWEAVIAGRDPALLWAGVTGYTEGEDGERGGAALEIAPPDEDGDRVIILGEIREDLHLCGQPRTLLAPRVLDPASHTFRGATMQRLPAAQREGAERIIASPHGGPADLPLARLLLATGASTAIGAPAALTDGDPATTWSEARPSDGHGEFVVMRAPASVPIARLAITIAPPGAAVVHGAAPRSFFLVTDDRTLSVSLPEDAESHPGAAYDIALADPLRTSCLALVLDKAYVRPGETHPEVTVAELTAYSAFDGPGATLSDVAKALRGGGARSEGAKELLARAGDPGLAAAAAAYGSLDAAGRALAIDAAIGAGTCEAAAPLLLAAMADGDREVARKGGEKIERCGKRAVPALLAALRGSDDGARSSAAKLVASIAPREALEPLVAVLAQGAAGSRAAVRSGVAKAARGASVEKLRAIVGASRDPEAELDLLRALAEELPAMPAEGDAAIGALEGATASWRTRYLLVEPIAALARSGDGAAIARLGSMLTGDPETAVRAHAAERAAGIAGVTAALARAVDTDAAPRVRQAALEALAQAKPPLPIAPIAPIARRLASDEWTFVRSAAAQALAAFAPDRRVDDALEAALADRAAPVRETVVSALAAHGDVRAAKAIGALLADEHEMLEVRLAAVKALAALCDRASLDLLTQLARRAPLAMASDEEIQIGFAAADALGGLHPADLTARLAPLAAKDASAEARTAAARALATAPRCR